MGDLVAYRMVMVESLMGTHIDIHGGGLIQFPHHENEPLKQNVPITPFANIWVHTVCSLMMKKCQNHWATFYFERRFKIV